MQWASVATKVESPQHQHESPLRMLYSMLIMRQGIIQKYDVTNLDQYHLVQYYGSSYNPGVSSDVSFIVVRKFFPQGNAVTFARNQRQITTELSSQQMEIFAILSWCQFLWQIAIPLKMFNFARVDLEEIFVETVGFEQDGEDQKRQSCRYVLGRLEKQSVKNEDTYLIISALAMTAWRYYSSLAENGAIVYRNGSFLHAKGINHFKIKSDVYWKGEELKETGLIVASAEAEKVLLKSLISTQETSVIWRDTVEYQIAAFTARFTIDNHMHKTNTWDVFDNAWGNVCRDWVKADEQ